jgi:sulfoacetaldehyde acetyltransferase
MSGSEALVETLVQQGVTDVFGIVGSAFMDALDLFPAAGIRFVSVQHEQGAAHMADGFSRVSNRHGVCIAQNGPGVSNFVTGMAAAYWAHSPVVAITPEGATATKGLGGFQEVDQLPLFEPITKYQAHVNNSTRIAELSGRAFDIAMHERGPTQINIPRDMFYGVHDYKIPSPSNLQHSAGDAEQLSRAAAALSAAKNPVILAGGGVTMSETGEAALRQLADLLQVPVVCTYLHNDAFPADHPLYCGPLGYQGNQAGMKLIAEADVILALGTRLSPFGTLPQYGEEYWPKDATIIQVDTDSRRLGMTKEVEVAICGDAGKTASRLAELLGQSQVSCLTTTQARLDKIASLKAEWAAKLDALTSGSAEEGHVKPRAALRALEQHLPRDVIVSTDIGNVCSVANSYLSFNRPRSMLAAMTFGNCGYALPAAIGAKVAAPERPVLAYVGDGAWGMSLNETLTAVRENIPITAVVFRNRQWGAEKKNQVLWFGDRYVGTNLEDNVSFAAVAQAMGAEGIVVSDVAQVPEALNQALTNQANGKTTIIEILLSKELGDPFRRDAMRLPIRHLDKYRDLSETNESPTGQPVDINQANQTSQH